MSSESYWCLRRARPDERSFGNRLPYWTPPVHKELPKTWGWGGLFNTDIDQYDLQGAIYFPGSQRVVSSIRKVSYEKARAIDDAYPTLVQFVGLLDIDLNSGKTRFLAAPQPTGGLKFSIQFYLRLSPTTVGIMIECSPSTGPGKPRLKPRQLLWSWNPQSDKLRPVGNFVPVGSLLNSLAGSPYSVSWLDREEEAWSGWTMLMNRSTGRFLNYLQAAKRIKYPANSTIRVNPFSGKVMKKPVFDTVEFHPTGNPHRILRHQYRVAPKSRTRQTSIECIDLRKNNAVVWKLDSDAIDKPPGRKSPLLLQFCDGMTGPCRHVVLRSVGSRFLDRPHEIWILDTENGKITKKFGLPDTASTGFEPDVSANGRFVGLETSSSSGNFPIVTTRGLYVLDTHTGRSVLHRTIPDLRPMMFLNAIRNDGTVIQQSTAGITLWKPPYKGDPKWVFEFKKSN